MFTGHWSKKGAYELLGFPVICIPFASTFKALPIVTVSTNNNHFILPNDVCCEGCKSCKTNHFAVKFTQMKL